MGRKYFSKKVFFYHIRVFFRNPGARTLYDLLVCSGDKLGGPRDSMGYLDNMPRPKPTGHGTYKYRKFGNGTPVGSSWHASRHGRSDRRARAVIHSGRRMRRAALGRVRVGALYERATNGGAIRPRQRAH